VLLFVYRLRHKGEKLDRERVRASRPDYGNVVVENRFYEPRSRYPRQWARCLGTEGGAYVVPVMDDVRVRVTATGMLIRGTECIPRGDSYKAKSDDYPQTWYCVVEPPTAQAEAAKVLEAARLLRTWLRAQNTDCRQVGDVFVRAL
jgi:hypothetical protein